MVVHWRQHQGFDDGILHTNGVGFWEKIGTISIIGREAHQAKGAYLGKESWLFDFCFVFLLFEGGAFEHDTTFDCIYTRCFWGFEWLFFGLARWLYLVLFFNFDTFAI